MTVDASGNLWIALYNGSGVSIFVRFLNVIKCYSMLF